jgi:hypothetical protein
VNKNNKTLPSRNLLKSNFLGIDLRNKGLMNLLMHGQVFKRVRRGMLMQKKVHVLYLLVKLK